MSQTEDASFNPFFSSDIFMRLPSVLLLTDADGAMQYCNVKARELLSEAIKAGESIYALMPNDLERRRTQKQASEAIRETNAQPRLRVMLRCADGTERLCSLNVYAIQKPGLPIFLLWQLEPSPRTLCRAMLDSVPEGLAVFDATGRLHDINQALASLLGYEKIELMQMSLQQLTPPEFLAQDQHNVACALRGEVVRYEKELIGKDGHRIPVLFSCRRLGDDAAWEPDLLVATVSDIRVTLTEALHAAMDASSNVLMLASPGLSITHVNQACLAFFTSHEHLISQAIPGFSAAKLVGSSIDQFHTNPAHARRILKRLVERTPGDEVYHHGHVELVGYAFSQMIRPVHIAGQFIGYSVEWRDVTAEQIHEARWQALLDGSEHGIVVLDAAGHVLETNTAANNLLGRQVDWQAVFGGATSLLNQALRKALATDCECFETWGTAYDGRTVYLRCHLKRLPKRLDMGPDALSARFVMTITELTDLKTNEAALAEQESYWRSVVDATGMGLFIGYEAGNEQRIVLANQAACDLLGYSQEECEQPGFFSRITPAEQAAWEMAQIQKARRLGQLIQYEKSFIHRDGHLVPVLLTLRPLAKEGYVCASFSDVTTLKAKERALAELAHYQQELFESITEGLGVFDISGMVYDINTAVVHLVGYTKEELLQNGWLHITPTELLEQDRQYIERALRGEVVRYEKAFIHRDGHRIPTLISYRKLQRQKGWAQDRLIASVSDTTNLKTAISRIQLSVSHIRSGLQNLTAGNKNLDQRTQQQAASTEEISTAIEELSGSVAQSAEHAAVTARRADEVRSHAEAGSKLIEAAEEKMAAIAQASQAIAEIITVVDEIAFTTNILALNAAVEAARAGEHGRGFAVVATEVRRLAQSSASNAKHIKQLIARSTSLITEGSHLSAQGTQAFNAILAGIREVSERIAEIAEATSSQGHASAQLTGAITEISRTTQANSALVEENSTACASLADQAEQLEELAGMLGIG
jgi:PAS domain S-box-containing protein